MLGLSRQQIKGSIICALLLLDEVNGADVRGSPLRFGVPVVGQLTPQQLQQRGEYIQPQQGTNLVPGQKVRVLNQEFQQKYMQQQQKPKQQNMQYKTPPYGHSQQPVQIQQQQPNIQSLLVPQNRQQPTFVQQPQDLQIGQNQKQSLIPNQPQESQKRPPMQQQQPLQHQQGYYHTNAQEQPAIFIDSKQKLDGLHIELCPFSRPRPKALPESISSSTELVTKVNSSSTFKKVMTTAALGVSGVGLIYGAGLVVKATGSDAIFSMVANYWTTVGTMGADKALSYLMQAAQSPAMVQALSYVPIVATGGVIAAIGLLAFYHREKIMGALKSAWETAKSMVRYVYGSTPDSSNDMAQVIAIAKVDAMKYNADLLPDNLRDVLPHYYHSLSVKKYLQWVQQAVATHNAVNQYLLARHAVDLISNPFDPEKSKNQEYPIVPIAQTEDAVRIIIEGGPFTIATAFHCIYFFTQPYVDPDVYCRFVRESGLAAVPAYLMGVQTQVNKQGIERAVKFLQIHIDYGLGVGHFGDLLDRNVDEKDAYFFDLMWIFNLARVSVGSHDFYRASLSKVIDDYVRETVNPLGGMPKEHQDALDHFAASLKCFIVDTKHEQLCNLLRAKIGAMTKNIKVDMSKSENYHVALFQDYDYKAYQLEAARHNAFFLAYSLRELEASPEDAWSIGLKKFSTKLVAQYYSTIESENAQVPKLLEKMNMTMPQTIQSESSAGVTPKLVAYPTTPCMTKGEQRVYIPTSTLPTSEDFDSLTNEARLKVVLGVLYLMTGIHPDELREYQFYYELALQSQLDLLIKQYCEAPERNQKSRVNFQ